MLLPARSISAPLTTVSAIGTFCADSLRRVAVTVTVGNAVARDDEACAVSACVDGVDDSVAATPDAGETGAAG